VDKVESSFKNIIFEKKEEIATIIINRPKVLNALNKELLQEIKNALENSQNDKTTRVIIITGAGPRAFCAGADIPEFKKLSPIETFEFIQFGQDVFNLIENLSKPVIAAVNGYALGGGLELAMACDIIIASDKARFGQPEINLGLMPGYGGTQRLTRIVGNKKAKEIIMTGDMINADEAVKIGLANKVIPGEKLMEEATNLGNKLAEKSSLALKFNKLSINKALETTLSEGLAYERAIWTILLSSEDAQEGTSAFIEKRKPIWKDK